MKRQNYDRQEGSARPAESRVHAHFADFQSREDLAQDAALHWLMAEAQRPGQSESWYRQCSIDHVRGLLKQGRSLDSGAHVHPR
jgi:hypothetical protein